MLCIDVHRGPIVQLRPLFAELYSPVFNVGAEIGRMLVDDTGLVSDTFDDQSEDEAECCSRNCLHKWKAGEMDYNFCSMCQQSTFVCEEIGNCAKEFASFKQKAVKYLTAVDLNPGTRDLSKVPPRPPCDRRAMPSYAVMWAL